MPTRLLAGLVAAWIALWIGSAFAFTTEDGWTAYDNGLISICQLNGNT